MKSQWKNQPSLEHSIGLDLEMPSFLSHGKNFEIKLRVAKSPKRLQKHSDTRLMQQQPAAVCPAHTLAVPALVKDYLVVFFLGL